METRRRLQIPEESNCVRWVVICGAVMLLMQCCWLVLSWEAGGFHWDFRWTFPLDIHGEGIFQKCQINDLAVPILLIVLGIGFAKRDPELLTVPLACKLFGDVCWVLARMTAEGVWNYSGWQRRSFLQMAPGVLLFLAFSFVLSGRVRRKGWLLLFAFGYPVFLVVHALFTFLAVIGREGVFAIYVPQCLEIVSFFLAYGILGLGLRDDPGYTYQRLGVKMKPMPGGESTRYTAYELLEEKSIARCMVLSMVTVGVYSWFWAYSIMKRIRYLQGRDPSCAGEMFCFLLVPFYTWYWFYTRGGRLADGAREYGIYLPRYQGICLLALLLAGKNMALALMQSELNEFARLKGEQPPEESGEWLSAEEKLRASEENFWKD